MSFIEEIEGIGNIKDGDVDGDPEFYCACDECGMAGSQEADGWVYNPDTGILLCQHCDDLIN